jgi:hypothetical protein
MSNAKERPDAWDEAYEMASGWLAIWGLAFAPAWLTNYFLKASTSVSYSPRLALSGVVLLFSFFSISFLARRMPKRASKAREFLYQWRHPIVIAAVAALSYQWGAYDNSRSDTAVFSRAAALACAESAECRRAISPYDINQDTEATSQ